MKYWISVMSRDHAKAGEQGGFIQAAHGRSASLHALGKGDVVFAYSPGTTFRAGTILQAFTAIVRVADDAAYAAEISARDLPWRRTVTALTCEETPIAPLVSELDFIEDKTNWEASLRRGMFEISLADAERLARAMHADIAEPPR